MAEIHPERLAFVARIETDVASCADLPDSIDLLIAQLNDLLCADGAAVDLLREEELVTCYATPGMSAEVGRGQALADSTAGDCLRSSVALKSPNVMRDPRFRPPAPDRIPCVSMIAVPLYVHSAAVGVVRVISSREAFFDEEDLTVARLLTGALGRKLIQAVRAEIDEGARASVGGSTDVAKFEDRRKSHLRHAERYGYPVTLLVCRLGGYLTGDILDRMGSLVRATDDCFRLDANEFAFLMPGTSPEEGARAGRRIKRTLEAGVNGPSGVSVEWEARALDYPPASSKSA